MERLGSSTFYLRRRHKKKKKKKKNMWNVVIFLSMLGVKVSRRLYRAEHTEWTIKLA